MYLVGLDGSYKFDAYIQDSNVKIYLVGQTKDSVVYYVDDIVHFGPEHHLGRERPLRFRSSRGRAGHHVLRE